MERSTRKWSSQLKTQQKKKAGLEYNTLRLHAWAKKKKAPLSDDTTKHERKSVWSWFEIFRIFWGTSRERIGSRTFWTRPPPIRRRQESQLSGQENIPRLIDWRRCPVPLESSNQKNVLTFMRDDITSFDIDALVRLTICDASNIKWNSSYRNQIKEDLRSSTIESGKHSFQLKTEHRKDTQSRSVCI